MKELKVGERTTITLIVVEQKGCKGCFFDGEDGYCGATSLGMECEAPKRQLRGFVISLNRGRTACSVADGGL